MPTSRRRHLTRPIQCSLSRFGSAMAIAAALGFASQVAKAQTLTWDPIADGDSLIGGTGIWNTSSLFWDPTATDLVGVDHVAWPNNVTSVAVFGGTPGTATITTGTGVSANGLTFNVSGYVIGSAVAADTLNLVGATPTITVTNAGTTARINSVMTGAAGFVAAGAGNLVLSGANTFTGQTIVNAGTTLSLTNFTALGASGTGNETIVNAGGTVNIGGQTLLNERFNIAGTGVGGAGAIVNQGTSNPTNPSFTLGLTADATINAGGNIPVSYNAAGAIVTGAGGRIDVRLGAAAAAGSGTLSLGGFTLTKTGQHLLAIVNHDVSPGNIVIDDGQLNFESGASAQGAGTITVNPNGKLGFWQSTTGAVTRQIVVNGGTIGDPTSTGASQTVSAPITLTGAGNPNFVATANTTTLSGLIDENAGSTITEVAKRGGATLAFSNQTNSFDAPITVYAGNLQGNYTTAFVGGVAPAAPVLLTGTPLGTAGTITVAGGTLNIRVDGAADATNQVFSIGKTLTVDRAPSGINLDRISTGSDKNLALAVTFAPPSASNGYSIGQNQLTGAQGNAFRTQFTGIAMNNDTVLNVGDFTVNGNATSANKNSLIHIGGNSWGFIGGTSQEFNALFNVGSAQLRIGSMYGTGVTNDTVTAGTGTIYNGPNNSVTFRTPGNIAPGQTIDLVSQRAAQASANFEQFTSIPANLRAVGSGVIGVGNAGAFGNIDLPRIGDGTFRVASGLGGSGNGVITGFITPGAGNVLRVGGMGTTTLSGTNRVTGSTSLDVGSDLINGGFRSTQNANENGTVVLNAANDYTGGTTVNRSSVLRFQDALSLGSGAVNAFGTITAEGATGTFILPGGIANRPVTLNGGSTLRFDSSALTTAVDTDRWLDSAPIALTASTLQLDARNNGSTTNETVGAISYSGGSTISLTRNNQSATQIVQLQTPSLTRVGAGSLEVLRSGSSSFGTTVRLLTTVTTPPVTNGMITPAIVAVDGTRLQSFATYDANGFNLAPLAATITTGTPAGTFPTGLLDTGIYYTDFAAANTTLTLADNPIIYALKLGGGTAATTLATAGTNITVTLRSGGLIFSGDNTAGSFSTDGTRTINVNPNLVANDGVANVEAAIDTRNAFTGVLNGTVTANGLTKFGAGTLNLMASSSALTGTVSANQGTLQGFGTTASNSTTHTPFGSGGLILNGGQINVRTANALGTTFTTSNVGSYTLPNSVTVAQNIPIATLDVNRSGTDVSSTGTFTFNPAAVGGTGLQLLGSPGEQGQTFTLSGANYGVTFGTNAVNSFAGNVTINNAVTLQLNNAPVLSGINPVLTKSGGGNFIVGAVAGAAAAPVGTQVVMNDGILELRSVVAVGTGDTTTLQLNRGTLNLRRDSAGTYGTAGSGTAYPVFVNGAVTISADRVSAGSNFIEGLGKLTVRTEGTLTVNSGNGVSPEFTGALLQGTAFIASNVAPGDQNTALRFKTGFDVSGGALVKSGSGHLHLLNADNSYDGGTYVQSGIVRARATNTLGTGTVFVNPGATIDFDRTDNLRAGQALVVRGNNSFLPMISVNVNGLAFPTANVDTTAAPSGIVGLSNGSTPTATQGSYDNTINLSSLYGGGWSLGGVSAGAYDPIFTGASVVAGSGNLYRLGGGGTSFAMGTDTARVALTNVLTGPNNVRLGFDSGNLIPANATNFQYSIAGVNDFSGGSTIVHRGMVARLFSNNDGTRSGLSNSSVNVFGVLSLSGAASLSNGTANVNAVTLNPGSALFFDNTNGAANTAGAFVATNNTDRFNDATPIALNGAMLNLIGANTVASSENVGDVTYSRGARLRSQLTGTGGTSTLTLNNLFGGGPGNTLLLQTSAVGTLGAGDKIVVTNGAPASTNGMVTPSIINATDNTFVTHGANGFANVTYDNAITTGTIGLGVLSGTSKVDVSAAALNLPENLTVYAMRTNQSVNVSGPFNNVTIRSGGLIGNGGTFSPNLVFNDGTSNVEARIYTGGTLAINGAITANGITKSGNANLTINVPQTGYASGWTVNSGTLQINDLQGLGQSVPGNAVTLNGSLTTGGQASQAFGQTQLIFARDQGTPELFTFSGGPITVVNEATIRIAAGDNRNLQIPSVTLDSSNAASRVAVTLDVPNNRFRGNIPSLTLADDALVRVLDSGSTTDTGRITAAVVNQLTGTNKNLTKIGNRTLELTGSSSASFTGGSLTVSQGTLRIRDSGALGSATTATIVERNAALEIDTPAFTPLGTVTLQSGSIERWNREDVRGSTYNLPSGVNLQLNTNLIAPRTIGLNGGSLEGYMYADSLAPAVQRNVGSAVTVNLLANSSVGMNILQGQGYDLGRQPTVGQPFGDNITGAQLRVDGNITGAFNLTKTGLDTVMIAGGGNTYNNTIVEMGTLRLGANNTLPTTKVLTTRLSGVVDLYGSNQTVAGLGTLDSGPNPGGVGVGDSGELTNSGVTDNTLTVNNSANYTYNGVIKRNVAVTKTGTGTLAFGGVNTYVGATTVSGGVLMVAGSITGSTTTVNAGGTLGGTGSVGTLIVAGGTLAPGQSPGVMSAGDTTFSGGAFALEIFGTTPGNTANSYDQLNVTGGVSLTANTAITLNLGSFNPADDGSTSFIVINNDQADAVAGPGLFTFNGTPLSNGATFVAGAQPFQISYTGGTGNDVVLTAVPEPGTAVSLLGGFAALAGLQRFRRRRSVK